MAGPRINLVPVRKFLTDAGFHRAERHKSPSPGGPIGLISFRCRTHGQGVLVEVVLPSGNQPARIWNWRNRQAAMRLAETLSTRYDNVVLHVPGKAECWRPYILVMPDEDG